MIRTSKSPSREELKLQRIQANLIGIGMILALVAAGFVLGVGWMS